MQTLHILLVANEINDPYYSDPIYNPNTVELSFMPNPLKTYYLTHANYQDIIDSIIKSEDNPLFINLCDGMDTDGHPGECVVEYLEQKNCIYSGSSPRNFQWKKSDIKKYIGKISTPNFAVITPTTNYTEETFSHMSYPFIIKPNYNGGSKGISEKSRVTNYKDLSEELKVQLKEFEEIMVEEFINGREFTCLVCENSLDTKNPYVLEPRECVFVENKTYNYYEMKWELVNYVKVSDSIIEKQIMDFCKDLYVTMDIDGYVRFDLRMNNTGKLFVNDVNPYCGIFYPKCKYDESESDNILFHSKILNHRTFVEESIKCGIKRQLRNKLKLVSDI